MVSFNFCTLSIVPLSFFDYQWYPRVIKRFTTITFSNFSVHNRQEFSFSFIFFECFKLKNKRKRKNLTVLDGKKSKKVTVVKRSITRGYH